MSYLITTEAKFLSTDGKWDKGTLKISDTEIVFVGRKSNFQQPYDPSCFQIAQTVFQKKVAFINITNYGVKLTFQDKKSLCFSFDKKETSEQIIASMQQLKKTSLCKKAEVDSAQKAAPSFAMTSDGKKYLICSEPTSYIVLRIKGRDELAHIDKNDNNGCVSVKLQDGKLMNVLLDHYLQKNEAVFVSVPEDEIPTDEVLETPVQNDTSSTNNADDAKAISTDDENLSIVSETNDVDVKQAVSDNDKNLSLSEKKNKKAFDTTQKIQADCKPATKRSYTRDQTEQLGKECSDVLKDIIKLRKQADALLQSLHKEEKEYIQEQVPTSPIKQKDDSFAVTDNAEELAQEAETAQVDKESVATPTEIHSAIDVGTTIRYGQFKRQDVEWIVLKADSKQCLLISKSVVATREFHNSAATWGSCSLRKWLNSTFLTKAFTSEQRDSIVVSENQYSNADMSMAGVNREQVFILSKEEARSLLQDNIIAYVPQENGSEGKAKWWLRDSEDNKKAVCYVDEKGNILSGNVSNSKIGVRPAICVKTTALVSAISSAQKISEKSQTTASVLSNGAATSTATKDDTNEVMKARERKKQDAPIEESMSTMPYQEGEVSKEATISTTPFKTEFLKQCRDFATQCVTSIPEKRVISNVSKTAGTPIPFLFDLANCRFSHMEAEYRSLEMPLYFHTESGKLVKCRKDGIYNEELLSPYNLFTGKEFVGKEEILCNAISDSIGNQAVKHTGIEFMCLMPDIVDDFNHSFRNQLTWEGMRLFQVPRSIALAYTVYCQATQSRQEMPEEFLCLDYDCEEFNAIKIIRSKDEKRNAFFIRMGRYPVSGNHPSYRTLAMEYITRYKEKYHVTLTKTMIDELVNSKLLQQILLSSDGKPALLKDGNTWVDIWPDQDIVNELHAVVAEDIERVCNATGISAYAICSFGYAVDANFYGIDGLEIGCMELCDRFKNHRTLWEEYLPNLQLGVHLDGTFADLELIEEKDRHQRITSTYLGNVVHFTIREGRKLVKLDANREYYDLPLVRDVYGKMNKEKMARFTPEKPFTSDEFVRLQIDYHYGDVDSYKLIALFDDDRHPLESEWCDAELLPNPAPKYTAQDRKPMYSYGNSVVRNGLTRFVQNINAPMMRWGGDSLYYLVGKNGKPLGLNGNMPYSRYLEDINGQFGFPFRQVRYYFDRGNQTADVKNQINQLLQNGVFSCIGSVLQGDLPIGHNLSKGSSASYPNFNQKGSLLTNLQKVCAEFGILYTIDSPDVSNIIKGLSSCKTVEIWAPVTTYVRREQDLYGVWDKFSKCLYAMTDTNPGDTIYKLRVISNVCFMTQEWIFELFHGTNGHEDIEHLLKCIRSVLYYDEWNRTTKNYNARKIRDVLELLLCICTLKVEDPSILDCNAQETKEIVRQLKFIDNEMRRLKAENRLDNEFNCRVMGISLPEEYYKVNKVIYALIETLTGGKSINLVGFQED